MIYYRKDVPQVHMTDIERSDFSFTVTSIKYVDLLPTQIDRDPKVTAKMDMRLSGGFYRNPIKVCPAKAGKYYIINGHHRFDFLSKRYLNDTDDAWVDNCECVVINANLEDILKYFNK